MGLKLNKEKLLERQARLRGKGTPTNRVSQFWFPEEGTYMIRLLPWNDHPDEPFKEIWWYYNLAGTTEYKGKKQKGKAPMTLRQFGEDDPIAERISVLRAETNEDFLAENRDVEPGTVKTDEQKAADLEFAKNLYGSRTVYNKLVVRGLENEGPKIWPNSSRKVYDRLIDLFLKDRVGETFMDISPEGRDLEVKVMFNRDMPGNTGKTVTIDFDLDPSPLSEDEEQVKAWDEAVLDPMKIMEKRRLTYSELEKRYSDWMAEGTDDDNGSEHTEMTDAPEAQPATSEPVAEATEATEEKPKKAGRKKKDMKAALADLAGKKG